MSASTGGPTYAHRTVATIRSDAAQSPIASGQPGPGSPQTPIRGSPSAFNSPSSLRADEETLIVELGTRFLRVGLAGDAAPKATLPAGPAEQRRTGDFTFWLHHVKGFNGDAEEPSNDHWSRSHEILALDVRSMDLGLVADKLERALRDALCNYLLVDSRPRRICLVLPPALPIPLLSTVLDTLFNRFHAPTVSLASSSVMTAIAAGVRSATVVDIGWAGTTVSSVYEYREIRHTRSTRGGRCLVQEVHKRLKEKWDAGDAVDASVRYTLSFEECERVAIRSSWISPMHEPVESRHASLPTVQEDIEGHAGAEGSEGIEENNRDSEVRFKLTSSDGRQRAASVHIRDLADPCENAFIAPRFSRSSFDDEETPLPELIYRHLLSLPIDARATCMSRLIFTGGCAAIPGLKQRLYHELSLLVCQRGWDAVVGRAADVARAKAKANSVDDEHLPLPANQEIPASASPETSHDAVFGQARRRERNDSQRLRGELRVLDSLGPWTGASLAHQVKATAIATVDRELWLQQGIHGASRPNDVDSKAQQRQSLGSGVIRGASGTTSAWTLGAWGFP